MKPLRIQSPCTEPLDSLSPESGTRYCHSCRHAVKDFSNMSDAEIIRYLQAHPGTRCGMFRPEQMGRNLVPERVPGFFLRGGKGFATAAALLMFFSGSLNAAELRYKPVPVPTEKPLLPSQPRWFTGIVTTGENHRALAGAEIVIPGTSLRATTDAKGQFSLDISGYDAAEISEVEIYYKNKLIETRSLSATDLETCVLFQVEDVKKASTLTLTGQVRHYQKGKIKIEVTCGDFKRTTHVDRKGCFEVRIPAEYEGKSCLVIATEGSSEVNRTLQIQNTGNHVTFHINDLRKAIIYGFF